MTTYSRDAYLSRDRLPASAFAIPERRAWPIHNLRHARIALRYMREGKGDRREYPRIRRAIAKRWPGVTEASAAVSRDVQVIIRDSGSSSGKAKKRQRYDPAKAKKRKKRTWAHPKNSGKAFLARMRAKYGDRSTEMSTESPRDPERRKAFEEGARVAMKHRRGAIVDRTGNRWMFGEAEDGWALWDRGEPVDKSPLSTPGIVRVNQVPRPFRK